MKIPFGSLASVLLSGLIARDAAAQARLARPTIDTVNRHIVRVMNNGPTAWADTNGWKLVLERTVQPKDGTAGELGDPRSILLLRDGRLIVRDEKPSSIRLYDATGKFARTLGRDGAGPGEYRDPELLLLGDTLVFHDPTLTRATFMTLDGRLLRSFTSLCCHFGGQLSIDAKGRLRATGPGPGGKAQWVRFDPRGARLDSMIPPVAGKPAVWTETTVKDGKQMGSTTWYVPLGPQNGYLFLHDGSVLYGFSDRYEFLVTRNGTDTARIFGRRDVTPTPVPGQLRDSLFHSRVDKNDRLRAIASAGDMPKSYPYWTAIHEDGAGNIWVRAGTGRNKSLRYDVFAPDGRLLGAVPIPFEDSFQSWTADHVAVLGHDADDLPIIRIYRIDRRGH